MATDKNGLTVACAVGMGGLFGEGMYLKDQGFFLSNGLSYDHPEDIAVVIQTNPDETDVSLVLAGADGRVCTGFLFVRRGFYAVLQV